MMKLILRFYEHSQDALSKGISVAAIMAGGWCDKLIKIKYDIPNDKPEMFDTYAQDMDNDFSALTGGAAVGA